MDASLSSASPAASTAGAPGRTDGDGGWFRAGILFARCALGAAFLSAVASRFGIWKGHAGLAYFPGFVRYTAEVNSFLPAAVIPYLAWAVTVAELTCGAALILGVRLRLAAFASAGLLALFATAMAISFGLKSPLDDSVYSASAAALLLGLTAPAAPAAAGTGSKRRRGARSAVPALPAAPAVPALPAAPAAPVLAAAPAVPSLPAAPAAPVLPAAPAVPSLPAAPASVVRTEDLPFVGMSHQFVGARHGVTTSLFLLSAPPGRGPRLHRHEYDEVIVVLEGSGTFQIGDDLRQVVAGEIVVVPAHTLHTFVNSGDAPLRQIDIHASPEFRQENLGPPLTLQDIAGREAPPARPAAGAGAHAGAGAGSEGRTPAS